MAALRWFVLLLVILGSTLSACSDTKTSQVDPPSDVPDADPSPNPDPQPTPTPDATPDPDPAPDTPPEPDPLPDATPEPDPDPDPEPTTDPNPEPEPEPDTCTFNRDCLEGDFCETPEGACRTPNQTGLCETQPTACDPVVGPVCACNGTTYNNDCERKMDGVRLLHQGACDAPPNPCRSNEDCDEDSYCQCEADTCQSSFCTPRPPDCIPMSDPVCGCDARTYENDCLRRLAGVCLFAEGVCDADDVGCRDNDGCDGSELCLYEDNTCGRTDPGVCEPRPGNCGDGFDPVCGCDGVTYDNRCEALSAGVSIRIEGTCPDLRRCDGNGDCNDGEFCDCNVNQSCEGQGRCIATPPSCPLDLDPVCGCDGITYDNDCFRQIAQTCRFDNGPCPLEQTLCRAPRDCEPGQVCLYEDNACHEEVSIGVCTDVPPRCPDITDPVCGCDGVSYDTRCAATTAGVSIEREGPCEPDPDQCTTDDDCGAGAYCECAFGVCGAGGFCTPLPDACGDGEPVCGCDDVTYANNCVRRQARVCLQNAGACDDPPPDGCRGNQECPSGTFCEFGLDTCDEPDRRGECLDIPLLCDGDVLGPVCGCDGITYPSNCDRMRQGVSLAFRGTCDEPIQRCSSPDECGEGRICECFGVCGFIGACKAAPEGCILDDIDPVCGCDGVTYDNDCLRQQAGTCLLQPGPCEERTLCIRSLGLDCGIGEFCDPTEGLCRSPDAVGVCVNVNECDDTVLDPVCGCDNTTYSNDCLRARAGIPRLSEGRCPEE